MTKLKVVYIRCWTCVGNGLVSVVIHNKCWGTAKCTDCNGTGKIKAGAKND